MRGNGWGMRILDGGSRPEHFSCCDIFHKMEKGARKKSLGDSYEGERKIYVSK